MFYVPEGFGFQHIPEEDRDQAAPVAFRLVPLPPNAFEQSKPFTGRVEEA
jgi:hypothetical protein